MSMKKQQSAIFRDTAVFDYVSGNQSDGARENFEQKLADDLSLQQEVTFERSLRSVFVEDEAPAPVSKDNFDALLDRIDQAEAADQDTTTDRRSWFGPRQFGVAASIIAVCLISINLFSDVTKPKFVTLSDAEQTQQTDFTTLVEQRRLAKIVLTEADDLQAVQQLLAGYQLESLDATPQRGAIVIKAARSIDAQMLAGWRADQRVASVEIIEFGGQK